MRHLGIVVWLAVLAAAPAFGQSPYPATVDSIDAIAGELVVHVAVPVTVAVPVIEERVVLENGVEKKVKVTVTVHQTTMQLVAKKWTAKGGRILDGSGKELAAERLWRFLRKGDVVLLTSGPVDDAWFKLLKPEVILLVEPAPPPVPAKT